MCTVIQRVVYFQLVLMVHISYFLHTLFTRFALKQLARTLLDHESLKRAVSFGQGKAKMCIRICAKCCDNQIILRIHSLIQAFALNFIHYIIIDSVSGQ